MIVTYRILLPALRYFLIALAALLMVSAARQGIASYYFQKTSPDAVQKAMDWDSINPVYPATLANLIHLYGDNADPAGVIRLYQIALELSPFDAGYCADLAQAHEWAGHADAAVPLFQRALTLFPNSPEINWKLANFYVRNGRASESAVPLRKVIRSAAIPNAQVFALTASAGLEPSTVIQDLLPPDSSVFFDYLNFQIDRTNIDAAQQTWDHLLLLKSPFTISQTFQYLDALIKLREVNRATQVWLTLASRFPAQISVPPSRDNLLTNGNFHADILNGGFDWRVNPVVGALVTQEYVDLAPNLRALRIDFDGSENLFFNSALQFAPVQPDKEYSFSATLRSDRITTDSGVGVQITEAYGAGKVVGATDKLVGSSPWAEQRFTFRTGPNTRLLVVSIVRTPSAKFDSKIAGTFWLTRAALVAASP